MMKMKSLQLLSVMVLFTAAGFTVELETLPQKVASGIEQLSGYQISDRINPYYLRGDFDGDMKMDYAVLVTQRDSKKRGIAVILSSRSRPVILGAGNSIQYGGSKWDDLNFDSWRVYGSGSVDADSAYDPPRSKGELIFVQKLESASGFFQWKGTQFVWVQQGD